MYNVLQNSPEYLKYANIFSIISTSKELKTLLSKDKQQTVCLPESVAKLVRLVMPQYNNKPIDRVKYTFLPMGLF